jgi:phosphoribosylformylglycinamidine (FGAM) synthase-like enzyme
MAAQKQNLCTENPTALLLPLQIMIDGPLGGAAFNNEFGRPNLGGYFRTYEQNVGGTVYGYHKPIMIAGGIGSISAQHTKKNDLPVGSLLIQLGGPGMRIGMGAVPLLLWRREQILLILISIRFNAAIQKWSGARRR